MSRKAKILIINDNPMQVQATGRMLEQTGHQVLEATTGQDGLRLARKERPDLVLLGVVLPDISGLEVCRHIKVDPKLANTGILLSSSLTTEADLQARGLEAIADGYIAWPASSRELVSQVEATLLKRTEHALRERVKELNCLYGLSTLVEQADASLDEILTGTVALIPPAWQYPEVTCARILISGQEYRTENFRETAWKLARGIVVHGKPAGAVEVYLLEEKPELDEGPFLKEERSLLDAIAKRLGRVVERLEAEEQLRQSEARWRSLTETSPDHILMLDADLNIEFANFALPGLTVEDLIGTRLYTYVEEERQAEIKAILEGVRDTGQPANYETTYYRPDGSVIYYESRVVAHRLAGSEPIVGLTVSARDITEHKRMEQALRESKRRLNATGRMARVGGWELDAETMEVRWTEETYRIHEVPPDYKPPLQEAIDFFHPEDRERLSRAVERALNTGEPYDMELRFITARGNTVWTRTICQPQIVDGKIVKLVGAFQDITERREAEANLARERERMDLILSTLNTGLSLINPDMTIAWVNAKTRRMFPDQNPEGQVCYRFFEGRETPCAQCGTRRAFEENEIQEIERFNAADGRWYQIVSLPIADEAGHVVNAIEAITDITERKQVEEALHISLEKYRVLFESFPLGITVAAQDGSILEVNRASEKLLGITLDEHTQRTIDGAEWQIIRPDGSPMPPEEYASVRALENRRVENTEMGILKGDGDVTWINVTAAPIPLEGYGVTVTYSDITERKRAEEALQNALAQSRQSEWEVAALLEGARAVLEYQDFDQAARAIFDVCKDLLAATSGYVALLSDDGQENELLFLEAGGLPCIVDPELPMPIRGLRAEAYRTGQAVFDNEFPDSVRMAYMPEGHCRLDNVLFAPLELGGQVMGLLGLANKGGGFTGQDARLAHAFAKLAALALRNSQMLQTLQTSEATLLQQADELARSNRELEQFAYAISHDLQEPLRMVSNFLRLLEKRYGGQLDDRAQEFVGYAMDGAERMQIMIRGLLDLSRVTTRGREFAPVDGEAVLAQTLRVLQAPIENSGATVTHDPLPTVLADDVQLDQVFQNLIGNALKFRGEGPPQVHVSAERQGDCWRFAVQDDGIGLDPAQADYIFGVFQRLHTRAEYEGMGMGLAICKRIVERHRGRIWVESEPGQGATFFFTIPAQGL